MTRSDLSGANVQQLHYTNVVSPTGITIDFLRNHLVWGDMGTMTIEYSNLDGNDRGILVNVDYPFKVCW